MTKKDLAQVAGYSYRRLHDIDLQLPNNEKLFVRCEDGKYNLTLFVQRWVQYNVEATHGDDRSLDEVKAIHERVKTRKTELEVAKMEGALVDVQQIRRLWADIANTVMQAMLRLPSKIAPQIMMIENVESITDMIDRELRDVLTQIAETPLPAYIQPETEQADDEEGTAD